METQTSESQSGSQNNYSIPVAIIVAGGLIAFAVYSGGGSNVGTANVAGGDIQENLDGLEANTMRPIDGSDHILGNPDAFVKIVEYSDTECPFCKRFHETMQEVMNEYGAEGQVAWVYRHLPLTSLHPKAFKQAEATECANKLGGNEAFWTYINKIFEITPSNNGLDNSILPDLAADMGLDKVAFTECLDSGEFTTFINESIVEATNAGARGTPYSLVVTSNGQQFPINGAQPYASVKQTIDAALATQ